MIARLIRWSASNLVLVSIACAFAVAAGHLCRAPCAARRHPRSLRHAGHRLHRVFGPGAAGHRGSGHLSAVDGHAVGAEIQGGPRFLVLRRLVRLRHLRGRHRHLLGALARARISVRRGTRSCQLASRRRSGPTRPASAGSTSTPSWRPSARLPSCARRRTGRCASRVAKAEGVAEVASVGGFVRQYQRRRRSAPPQGLRHLADESPRRHPAIQHGRRRPRRRACRDRIHGARPRLSARHRAISNRSCSRPKAARPCCCATWPASSLRPTSGAASPS